MHYSQPLDPLLLVSLDPILACPQLQPGPASHPCPSPYHKPLRPSRPMVLPAPLTSPLWQMSGAVPSLHSTPTNMTTSSRMSSSTAPGWKKGGER